jgi:hypothetical protein
MILTEGNMTEGRLIEDKARSKISELRPLTPSLTL